MFLFLHPPAGKATLAMNLILLMWVLLGGFLVNAAAMPDWISWIRYVAPLFYAFEALLTNEVQGVSFSLGVPGLPQVRQQPQSPMECCDNLHQPSSHAS